MENILYEFIMEANVSDFNYDENLFSGFLMCR